MAISLDQKPKKDPKRYLIFVVPVIVVLIIAIVWFFFLNKEEESFSEDLLSSFAPRIKIDFRVLDSPFLKELKLEPFPSSPSLPPESEVGRINPFLPFSFY